MNVCEVAIIILNWNGYKVTVECLNSLLNIDFKSVKIIIVDNGSSDGSAKKLRSSYDESIVDIISLKKNLGFTGGTNLGIKYAQEKYNAEYYLLLNNDTIVEPSFLSKMLSVFEGNQNCYAVVPKIFYYDIPDKIWFAGGKVSKLLGIVTHYGRNEKDKREYNVHKTIGFMNGCCALISSETIKEIGLLDDRFFANSEDADYSLRIINSGHTIHYAPDASVYHKVSYSFKLNKGKWLGFYLAARGIVLLQRKHLPKWQFPFFLILFSLRWVLYLTIKLFMLSDLKSIRGIFEGTWDGINNRLRYIL